MKSIIVRPIQTQEVNSFWELFSHILSNEFPGYSKNIITFFLEKMYTRVTFGYWLAHSTKIVLGAFINNDIVGFAVIDEPYGGVSFCRWLGVKKEYQKQGIGTKLIEMWTSLAISSGCHKIEVAAQPEAREFYKKVGLIEEGTRTKSYFGIDQYVFGKVIGAPNEMLMIKYR